MSTKIAGERTAKEWMSFREGLSEADVSLWTKAVDEYFLPRLELRYFEPIRAIQKSGRLKGEGFSIVAIQCSVIEFLEATRGGLEYRFLLKGEKLGEFEYSSSRAMFVDFLSSRQPFSDVFNAKSALDFYQNVRCGILHEARTKGGWRVRARGFTIADTEQRVLYRDNFQRGLQDYLKAYRAELLGSKDLQKAFVRKFDSLST